MPEYCDLHDAYPGFARDHATRHNGAYSAHAAHLSYNIPTSPFPLPLCGMLRFAVRFHRNAHPFLRKKIRFFVTFQFLPRYTERMMPDLTVMDDTQLIEHARQNPDAFGALYRRYLTPIYRYLYRRLGNAQDAEDLTAQVFTEALEGLVARRYREGGCFIAWLFTIARRRSVDFYRRRPMESLDDPPSPEPGILAAMEKGEDLQQLSRLLAQLDEDGKELLRMRFSAGLSFAEIGLVEGRSEAAVKMTIYRTLDHLREQWEVENE